MTIEQVKEEAKKRFDKDLTDEQAQAWLDAHPAGELQDEELKGVSGGGGAVDQKVCLHCGSSNVDVNMKYEDGMTAYEIYCRDCGRTTGGVDYH